MNKDEFKRLERGDHVSHQDLPGQTFIITEAEHDYDYSVKPPRPFTDAITVDDGRRMKLLDDRDVAKLNLVRSRYVNLFDDAFHALQVAANYVQRAYDEAVRDGNLTPEIIADLNQCNEVLGYPPVPSMPSETD
jgi:hypothetical protein